MREATKNPTFNFYIHKDGQKVNLKDLSDEEQKRVGIWAYQTIVKGLGYEPVVTNT